MVFVLPFGIIINHLKMIVKKAFLILMSIFLIWQSYKLIGKVNALQIDSWVAASIFGFLLNLFITGIFAFSGFALPTQKLLPSSYYEINNPLKLKRTFNLLKVGLFRKFLLATFWKDKDQRKKYFNGKAKGIKNLVTQSQKSEFGHLIPFIIISIVSIFFLFEGKIKLVVIIVVINCFFNWYPIILQRHHRMRVDKILKRNNNRLIF